MGVAMAGVEAWDLREGESVTHWLQRQLENVERDAETWADWKRREVGLIPMPLRAPPVPRDTPRWQRVGDELQEVVRTSRSMIVRTER
jgi:hypothetical protein